MMKFSPWVQIYCYLLFIKKLPVKVLYVKVQIVTNSHLINGLEHRKGLKGINWTRYLVRIL
jgi:hypothetical protein